MPTIIFKRQSFGQWRRDDGEKQTHVDAEAVFNEIEKLVLAGWAMKKHGVTHLRAIEVTKD